MKVSTKPFSLAAFAAAGKDINSLVVFGTGDRKVVSVANLGSERYPDGIVVTYKYCGDTFSQAFSRDGKLLSDPDSSNVLSIAVPETDLEVANEKLVEAEKKIASLKVAVGNALYYAETIKLIAQRTEAKYGTGSGMAKVQEYCQRVITESAKAHI